LEYAHGHQSTRRGGRVCRRSGFSGRRSLDAFIWTESGGIQALPELPGHVYSEADSINESDQVVGTSCDVDFVDCRAVVWEDGVVTDLNTLKQADFTDRLENGKDINDRGVISGRAIDPVTGARTAFVARPAHE